MRVNKLHVSKLVLIIMFVLNLAACGGSSSSSDPQSRSLTGHVADGYLSGATVFLDCNNNRVLDAGEVSTTTDTSGQYELDVTGVSAVSDCPVVAEVTDTTIDLDTDMPVRNAYTLVSPPGYTDFVSPLTTMIQVNYESNPGITISEAHDAVKGMLSVEDASSVSLFEDYIDNSTQGGTDADTYVSLHKFAQVTARVLGDNLDKLEKAAESQSFTITDDVKDEFLRLTMKAIMKNAELINEVVASDDPAEGNAPFNPDADAQAVDIAVDTSDVSQAVQQEQSVYENKVPTVKWAGLFRARWSNDGIADILALGLENDIDTVGYAFSVEGPQGFSYTFVADDIGPDPNSPVAMHKVYNAPNLLAAGEYVFYITPPGGSAVEVGRDTHDPTATVPLFSALNPNILIDANGTARVYHDTLNGTYYYRIVIRDATTREFLYRGKRQNSGVREFSAQYATAAYQYRIEAWDTRLFADATARSQTGWKNFGTPVNVGTGGAAPAYYGAYWRQGYATDATTVANNRKVLDIAIDNHDDLTELTISSDAGFSYTLPVTADINHVVDNGDYYLEKRNHTLSNGRVVVDYYLQIKNPLQGAETFTWTATTVSGGDFAVIATIRNQQPLPCVDPAGVTVSEDANSLLTISWDGVTAGAQGQSVFYRYRVRNKETKAQFRSKRMSKTMIYVSRSDIEDAVGAALTDANVEFRIEVIDSSRYGTIHNWSQFGYLPVSLD